MSGAQQGANMPGRAQFSLGARFALLAVCALVLMVVDHRQDHLRRVREILSLVVHPIQVAVDLPFRTFASTRAVLTDNATLRQQNERLENELLITRLSLQDYEEVRRENERLRGLLNSIEEEQDFEVRIAEILSVDMDNRQRFWINRGKADGVTVGQPLLDAEGIVGQVVAVFPLKSEAMLITDAEHAVPVTIERSNVRTIAEGTGDSGLLLLPYLTNTADIEVGDRLLTSGFGGVFPRGRPVAEVIQIRRQPEQQFAHIIARPLARLDRDQEVLLVDWREERSLTESATVSLDQEAAQ